MNGCGGALHLWRAGTVQEPPDVEIKVKVMSLQRRGHAGDL